jgi:hypothetical protein
MAEQPLNGQMDLGNAHRPRTDANILTTARSTTPLPKRRDTGSGEIGWRGFLGRGRATVGASNTAASDTEGFESRPTKCRRRDSNPRHADYDSSRVVAWSVAESAIWLYGKESALLTPAKSDAVAWGVFALCLHLSVGAQVLQAGRRSLVSRRRSPCLLLRRATTQGREASSAGTSVLDRMYCASDGSSRSATHRRSRSRARRSVLRMGS